MNPSPMNFFLMPNTRYKKVTVPNGDIFYMGENFIQWRDGVWTSVDDYAGEWITLDGDGNEPTTADSIN